MEGLSRDMGNKFRGWDFDLTTDKYIHPLEGLVFQKLFYEVFTYGTGCANNKCFHLCGVLIFSIPLQASNSDSIAEPIC